MFSKAQIQMDLTMCCSMYNYFYIIAYIFVVVRVFFRNCPTNSFYNIGYLFGYSQEFAFIKARLKVKS